MAQLKDTIIQGSARITDTLYTTTTQIQSLLAPTTAGGTTYSPGTNGYVLKSNGTSVYWAEATATSASTAIKFASAQSITLTGDITGSASSQAGWSIATTLANSGVTAGSYGDSGNQTPGYGSTFKVPYITVDAKGRVTSISAHTVKIPASDNTDHYAWSDITGKPSTFPPSDHTHDYMSEMFMAVYDSSTYSEVLAAYQAKKMVYCRVDKRLAFLAYVNNSTTPTEFEFQYYRSVATHTDSQQGDQVFVYKLNNSNGGTWSTTTREAYTKVTTGTNMSKSYSDGTLTLSAADPTVKLTAKTDNTNYKLLMGVNASPTSGSAYEAAYDTNITVNPSTHTIAATNFAGNATTATTADKLIGFSSRAATMAWGNQTGTVITCLASSGGGGWGFRDNNPASGQMSMTIDGTIYIKEGNQDISAAIKSLSVSGATVSYTNLWGGTGTAFTIPTTAGTSTLAWNSEVTLGTVAGLAIKAKLPSNPNSDTKVKQSASTTDSWHKLLLHHTADGTSTAAVVTDTNEIYGAVDISAQPSTGTVRANIYNIKDKIQLEYNTTVDTLNFVFI